MKVQIALVAALLVSGCDAKANDDLLASELTWSKSKDGWQTTIEISPWLADRADLVRRIKAERIAAMAAEESSSCEPLSAGEVSPCQNSWTYTLQHDGRRLVSVLAHNVFDGGGAHPITAVSDYLYDVQTGAKLRFGDLFVSWPNARAQLQQQFCEELRGRNSDYKCPAIEKQALALASSGHPSRASAFIVETQDYALGSYTDGTETVRIELTPQLRALINPEFRDEFAAAGS